MPSEAEQDMEEYQPTQQEMPDLLSLPLGLESPDNAYETPRSDDRIHLRIPGDLKSILEHAAHANGLSLSRYIITTMIRQARADVAMSAKTSLTRQEYGRMMEMIEQDGKRAGQGAREASDLYRTLVKGAK
jgi:uncharacterized protein (DUF1778 family)